MIPVYLSNRNDQAYGFIFKNFYSNLYRPEFTNQVALLPFKSKLRIYFLQPYEESVLECPEIESDDNFEFSECQKDNINFGAYCALESSPMELETRLVLTDRNNRNSSDLCTGQSNKKCTILNSLDLKTESDYFDLANISQGDYFIEKRLKLIKNFDYETNYFYNIELSGTNKVGIIF